MRTYTYRKAAEALAEAFTSPHGEVNPKWDINGPDDETNPYHLPVPMEERIQQSAWVSFIDTDGQKSTRAATISEIIRVLADANLLKDPSESDEVFEIYDKLTRTRLNEVIYGDVNDAFDLLSRANVDPRNYVVRSVRFEPEKEA